MLSGHRFALVAVLIGLITFLHGLVTWPLPAVLALFIGGALIAFGAEIIAIRTQALSHHIGPQVGGVPLYLLAAWPGTIYVAFRLSLLVTEGWYAVFLCATLATIYDVFTDYRGVEAGNWSFTDRIRGPTYRGVPWWNFVGWFLISCSTAALALPFL